MFSVEEVAETLNVSKVTIYAKLKKFNDKVVMMQGKKYITDELLSLIKQDLNLKGKLNNDLNTDEVNEEIAIDKDDLIKVNKELNTTLIQQLEEKDRQINELHKKIDELINLNKNNQVLLKQQQDKEIKKLQLEEHFSEVDLKLQDLREKMDERNKKGTDKKFFNFLKK